MFFLLQSRRAPAVDAAAEAWAPPELLPAWRMVPPPTRARRTARLLAALLGVFALACVISPWQQSVTGDGSVIAFDPSERPVNIEAPTVGVVQKWHVREGERVERGRLLVSIVDNDPALVQRLRGRRDALAETVERKAAGVLALETGLVAAELAGDAKIAAAGGTVDGARQTLEAVEQKVVAARAQTETARLHQARVEALGAEGLQSARELELARLGAAEAEAELRVGHAQVAAARADLEVARNA